nr:YfhO family protein [Lachnospiraceae bacterium]
LPGNYKNNKVNEKEIYTGKTELFEANTYLPVGYTYDSYVPRSEFEKMNVEDKQEVMLQGAVTEASSLPVTVYEKENKSIFEDIIAMDNVTIEGDLIKAGDNGSITVKIDPLDDAELYCIIDDITFEGLAPQKLRNEEEWETYSEEKKNRIIRSEKYKDAVNSCEIAVETGDVEKIAKYRRPDHQYYTGMDGFLINLGYQNDADKEMKVTFKEPGIYTFGRFDVVSQPLGNLDSRLEKLKEDSLKNIHIGVNEITGTLDLEKQKLLCMSVPYSTGWKAYVDGIETPVKNVNVMYMGIEVNKGHHDIRFVYRTPFWGIKEGLCVLGLLMVLIFFIIYQRRKGPEVKG